MHLKSIPALQALDPRTVTETMKNCNVHGCSIALLHEGELLQSMDFGVVSPTNAPVTQESLFECASLTKMHFSAMALKFCEDGLFDLDRPVMEQWSGTPWSDDPRFSMITPRHILSHTSGLPNWASKPMSMRFTPGTQFSYSGEGYYLLQTMIEQMTQQSLDQLLQQTIFGPLGMDAFVVWTDSLASRFSTGFAPDGSVCKVRDHKRTSGNGPEPNDAWSLYGNAHSLSRFLSWVISAHAGLGSHMFHEMTGPQVNAGNHVCWGLGTGLCTDDPNVVWHWGDNAGFQSLMIGDLATGDGMIIITNSSSGLDFCFRLLGDWTDFCGIPSLQAFLRTAE